MADSVSEPPVSEAAATQRTLKQIEAQLARMTKVFLDSADPIVIRDLDGIVLEINHETERVFGWSHQEIVGGRVRHLLTPAYREQSDDTLRRIQHGETVRNVEADVTTKSGKTVPVLATVFLLKDENDEPFAFAAILKDMTQQKEATDQLARRNRELQQFANVLAHDLGAPLRSICRSAELLRKECGAAINEEGREYLDFITDGVQRMDRMIDDLLKYARIEHQSVTFRAVDCARAFSEALANLEAAIAENKAEVTCDPLPTVHANRGQIVQLFQNLIGNAIKFRSADVPHIHVSAEQGEGEWRFRVRDNGIGIDPQHQEKIFDMFRRLHGDNVFPGSGIGLAICKAIVARHGGRIWVESVKGKGATFHFTIPDQPPSA